MVQCALVWQLTVLLCRFHEERICFGDGGTLHLVLGCRNFSAFRTCPAEIGKGGQRIARVHPFAAPI